MLRSMFAGVSGLRAHQTMMDVVGNNIANVNTTGFKASRTTFGDTLSQLQRGGASGGPAGTAGPGGINAQQVGLGVKVGAIDSSRQGATQITNRATDIAIQGEGYFVVDAGQGQTFTRAGAFSPDEQGRLTDISGYVLQGYQIGTDGALGTTLGPMQFQIGQPAPGRLGRARSSRTRSATTARSPASSPTAAPAPGPDRPGDLQQPRRPRPRRRQPPARRRQLRCRGDRRPRRRRQGHPRRRRARDEQRRPRAEFTNLIIAQRGFQANSRIITPRTRCSRTWSTSSADAAGCGAGSAA